MPMSPKRLTNRETNNLNTTNPWIILVNRWKIVPCRKANYLRFTRWPWMHKRWNVTIPLPTTLSASVTFYSELPRIKNEKKKHNDYLFICSWMNPPDGGGIHTTICYWIIWKCFTHLWATHSLVASRSDKSAASGRYASSQG